MNSQESSNSIYQIVFNLYDDATYMKCPFGADSATLGDEYEINITCPSKDRKQITIDTFNPYYIE